MHQYARLGFAASEMERCIECGVDLELLWRTKYTVRRQQKQILRRNLRCNSFDLVSERFRFSGVNNMLSSYATVAGGSSASVSRVRLLIHNNG